MQISVLEASNACCRSVLHVNGEDGLSRERKGDITDAMEKAYATWLTRPNQARMSVGVGNSEMARRYFRQGLTSVLFISNPSNSTSSWAKWNLLGLRVMPFLAQMSNHSVAWWNASSMESDQRRASSMHLAFFSIPATRLS